MPRQRQEFTIPQQYFVGDIKVNTEAQLDRTYTRLLLDAFVPYQQAMFVYLDELLVQHDPQRVRQQLDEVEKQSKKRTKDWEQIHLQFRQADASEQEKLVRRLSDIHDEEMALHKTTMELLKKLDIESRSQAVLQRKKEEITKLLQRRQEMLHEGTWEKMGGKDRMSVVFSILGDDEIGFGFSKITLQASPINDIFDWMTQYHPESLPLGEPFLVSTAQKTAPKAEKKAVSPLQTEFPNISDAVTANIRTFLAIRRPGYTLLSLLDRSQDGKKAWLAHLTRTRQDSTVEQVSDVVIELEPNTYMTIQNVQDQPAPSSPSESGSPS